MLEHELTTGRADPTKYPAELMQKLRAGDVPLPQVQEQIQKHFKKDWHDKCERSLALSK